MKDLRKMTEEELDSLSNNITDERRERRWKEYCTKSKSNEQILKSFTKFGYIVPPGSVFYRINHGKYNGYYGWKVGSFTHACHIDWMSLIVLLVDNGNNNELVSIDESNIEKVFTV